MTSNDALQAHLHTLSQRLDRECSGAIMRIQRARQMAEAVRATNVTVPPEIRAVARVQPGYRRMLSSAETRLEQILKEQLEAMKSATLAEAEALFAQYRQKDWQALRGTYATLYRRGEIEGQRLLHAKRAASES